MKQWLVKKCEMKHVVTLVRVNRHCFSEHDRSSVLHLLQIGYLQRDNESFIVTEKGKRFLEEHGFNPK